MYYERLMQVTGLTKQADFPFSGIKPSMRTAGLGSYTKLSPVNMENAAMNYNNARFGDALQSDGFATETNFNGGTPVTREKQTATSQWPSYSGPFSGIKPSMRTAGLGSYTKLSPVNMENAAMNYNNARFGDALQSDGFATETNFNGGTPVPIEYTPSYPATDAVKRGPSFTPAKPGTMTPTAQPAINVEPDIPGVTDVPAPAPGAPAIDMRSITGQFGTTPQQLTQTQVTPTSAKLPFQQEPNILSDIAAMKVQQPQMPQSQPQPLQPQTQPQTQYGYTMNDLNKLTSADAAKYSKHFGRGGYNANSINDRMKLQMLRNGVNPNASNFQNQLNQNLKTMGFNRTRNARRANQQLTNLGFKRAQ